MRKAILGKKVGMTQLFDENGKVIPVTVIEAGPCVVVQKKTIETDGYNSVQVGFEDKGLKKTTKAMQGHFGKADVGIKKYLKEFRYENVEDYKIGDIIKADCFELGDKVDVSGISKGKGFAGSIKRWNGSRLKMTHGTAPVHRSPGSLGACSSPSRVFKGKKMPGHMGVEKVTVQNLEIVKVDVEHNLIAIKGAVPGPRGGVITVTNSIKA